MQSANERTAQRHDVVDMPLAAERFSQTPCGCVKLGDFRLVGPRRYGVQFSGPTPRSVRAYFMRVTRFPCSFCPNPRHWISWGAWHWMRAIVGRQLKRAYLFWVPLAPTSPSGQLARIVFSSAFSAARINTVFFGSIRSKCRSRQFSDAFSTLLGSHLLAPVKRDGWLGMARSDTPRHTVEFITADTFHRR